jgi:hypothetical protein
MADANIFQTYLRQPKSVQDYMAEADRGDLTRLQLEGQRGQNALLSLTRQNQADAARASMEDRNALQRVAAGWTADTTTEQRIAALRNSGRPALMQQADALEASDLTRRKTGAEIKEKESKVAGEQSKLIDETITRFRGALDFIDTPQGAVRWLRAQYNDPILGSHVSKFGGVEQMAASIPTDPQGFQRWRQQAAIGMEKFMQEQRMLAANAETARHNVAGEKTAAGNLALARERLNFDKSAPRGQFLETPTGYVLGDPRAGTVAPVLGPDGKQVQGKAADRALTDSQAKANLFGSRMQEADKILSSLTGKYSPAAVQTKMGAEKLPGIGGAAGWAGNAMLSEESQQAEQAMRDFVNAVLRRESGAVISDSEFANAQKQYFPQPNDTDKNLKQKARNRQIAIEGLMAEVPSGKRGVPSLTNPGSPGPLKAGEVDAVAEALKKYGGN